eukprot:CAMPEP_0119376720 /NCGR_PEP_ID=MMETSP1334-20130426/40967_1 /TAXON_ID=127549 /ORGANISM="Calcidiscus leptoporus, Strain RCC1130" /LENGTH=95 /DNA_ID=CAMNT_0007395371 /DNA_START=230 /DNA_END=513 /DNA_ORIENTATION=+
MASARPCVLFDVRAPHDHGVVDDEGVGGVVDVACMGGVGEDDTSYVSYCHHLRCPLLGLQRGAQLLRLLRLRLERGAQPRLHLGLGAQLLRLLRL